MNGSCRRSLSAAVAVFSVGAAPSLAGDSPLIVPVFQERTISASASAFEATSGDSDHQDDAATGFGPFVASVGATASVPGALASCSAFQDSTLHADAIHTSGGTGYGIYVGGFGAGASVLAGSEFSVTFVLAQQSDYTLQGVLDGHAGLAGLTLEGPEGPVHEMSAFFQTVAVQESGTLAAGEYTLGIDSRVDDGGFDPIQLEGGAAHDVTLQFSSGPGEPGGEVPDGRDLPGKPLRVHKLLGTLVRLTWGPSCRASDVDYAVYEGPPGDPLGMVPLTCSTAGRLSYDFAPSLDAAAYLVVPTSGTSEGSYGEAGSGVERPPSPAACWPQLLGDPICP